MTDNQRETTIALIDREIDKAEFEIVLLDMKIESYLNEKRVREMGLTNLKMKMLRLQS